MNKFVSISQDLQATVAQARPRLDKFSEAEAVEKPQPGKWSKKEIIGHLLDSASNNHQRFVRAALEGGLVFPGYEQDRLVVLQRFQDLEWRFLTEFWTSYNRFLAHVIGALPEQAASVICAIGKNPPASLEWVAGDYVAHLRHHLNQILGKVFASNYGVNAPA